MRDVWGAQGFDAAMVGQAAYLSAAATPILPAVDLGEGKGDRAIGFSSCRHADRLFTAWAKRCNTECSLTARKGQVRAA